MIVSRIYPGEAIVVRLPVGTLTVAAGKDCAEVGIDLASEVVCSVVRHRKSTTATNQTPSPKQSGRKQDR